MRRAVGFCTAKACCVCGSVNRTPIGVAGPLLTVSSLVCPRCVQVAMAMFRAQHKPSPQWLQRAGSAAVREGNAGASALEWVQALAR